MSQNNISTILYMIRLWSQRNRLLNLELDYVLILLIGLKHGLFNINLYTFLPESLCLREAESAVYFLMKS